MQSVELYKSLTGYEPKSVTFLTPSGSNRKYYRLDGPRSLIGVEGVSKEENEAFIYLDTHFRKCGLPVPAIESISKDRMSYLLEDLGDTSLFECRDNKALLERAVRLLAHFHNTDDIDFSRCFPVAAFDRQGVMWDLNYFKYSYLNTSGISYSEPSLEADFIRLAEDVNAITEENGVFMYRDFQSRNVMVKNGQPWFIDFQGGRRGPAAYDLASFLWQAKAGFSSNTREWLTGIYVDEAMRFGKVDISEFKRQLHLMTLIRVLQVLGAYGFRGKFERKPHFIQSIPAALSNLRDIISTPFARYPYLMELLPRLITEKLEKCRPGLTVRVTSFSYKLGIPDDPSGNGGGFVFDCRAMDNPGRYEEYKKLTGLDAPVIEFLEGRGEMDRFLKACHTLVGDAVTDYMKRGFTSLSVNFGCTGGQHRSVYAAEHTAVYIKEHYPEVNVILSHREQSLSRSL